MAKAVIEISDDGEFIDLKVTFDPPVDLKIKQDITVAYRVAIVALNSITKYLEENEDT